LAYFRGHPSTNAVVALLQSFILVNLFLAIFNLLPVHPLDGGKVIEPFLPYKWNRWLEENQGALNMGLLVAIFMAGPVLAVPVDWACNRLLDLSALIGQSLV
jgi:Zn-dependent protease